MIEKSVLQVLRLFLRHSCCCPSWDDLVHDSRPSSNRELTRSALILPQRYISDF
jgi:hypothetical protein